MSDVLSAKILTRVKEAFVKKGGSTGSDLREELVQALRRVGDHGVVFSEALAGRLGISATDLKCASIVDQGGPLPAGRLAELTGLTTGAITGVIDRLEKAGFVRRAKDPADRRQVIVESVPARGKDFDELLGPFFDAMSSYCADYGDEELERLIHFLEGYGEVLQEQAARLRAGQLSRGQGPGEAFSAPLGSTQSGRLEFVSGGSSIRIQSDPAMSELIRGRFQGREPAIKVHGGEVRVEYSRFSLFDLRRLGASLTLNASIPWKLELRGGVSKLDADLRDVAVELVSVSGGASHVDFGLGAPKGSVPIRIRGGAHKLSIRRPADVPISVRVTGGAARLALDSMYFGAIGGPARLESPDYPGSSNHYDVEITGGVNGLTIESL